MLVTWQDAAGPGARSHHRSDHVPDHAELVSTLGL